MDSRPFLDPAGDHCDVVEDLAVSEGEFFAVGFLDRTPTCNDSQGGAFTDADIAIQRGSLSDGAVGWTRVRADVGQDNDEALAVSADTEQLVVSGTENGRAWIARMTPRGRFSWERRWGGVGSSAAVDVSLAPWASIYVLADRRSSPGSADGSIEVRQYAATGDLASVRSTSLTKSEEASAVATSAIGAVYVTARVFAERGDLWRL